MKPSELRRLMIDALPEATQAENDEPLLGKVYLPPTHTKALSLDRPIVLGERGAGKTFWLRCLGDDQRRNLVATTFGAKDLEFVDVVTGFDPTNENCDPDTRTLENLIREGLEPSDIWYAVMCVACLPHLRSQSETWGGRSRWIRDHAEEVSGLLVEANRARGKSGRRLLVAFDGLDRLAPRSWDNTASLLRGLLQVILEFSRFSNLRAKAFIRPDFFESPSVRTFPDASKLVSLAVSLEWVPVDLYGLTWQYLANANDFALAESFRHFVRHITDVEWRSGDNSIFALPEALRRDEELQRKFFHHIAGTYMGAGPTKGDTWRWLPNHLQDAKAYVSPRSFLVALRAAAEGSSQQKFSTDDHALHWRSIQEGVRKASKHRLSELRENFQWIGSALDPLKGLSLPARRQDIVAKWKRDATLSKIFDDVRKRLDNNLNLDFAPLPPNLREDDPGSLVDALERLGVCRVLEDRRVDFPDIVRIEIGMPRKGGVPVSRAR